MTDMREMTPDELLARIEAEWPHAANDARMMLERERRTAARCRRSRWPAMAELERYWFPGAETVTPAALILAIALLGNVGKDHPCHR